MNLSSSDDSKISDSTKSKSSTNKTGRPNSNLNDQMIVHHKKKRVGKACDSCRIKKTKCNGKKPCNKCIQDNKICVFTEKKVKEKNHPGGYIELLETRLDLLTRSFEKIVQLSTPHLKFLNDLMIDNDKYTPESMNSSDLNNANYNNNNNNNNNDNTESEPVVPVNKIITYLIENHNLLNDVPINWEQGAVIAANYEDNDIESTSKRFADHKSDINNNRDNSSNIDDINSRSDSLFNNKELGNQYENDFNLGNGNEEREGDFEFYTRQELGLDEFSLNNQSTGGHVLANSAVLNDGVSALNNELSDVESDSNSVHSTQTPTQVFPPTLPSQPGTINPNLEAEPGLSYKSLWSQNGSTDYFNGPITNNQGKSSEFGSTFLARSSSLSQRPRSPSHLKTKNNGHVRKPSNHIHNHSRSGSIISLNGNDLRLKKSRSSLSLNDPLSIKTEKDDNILPSDPFDFDKLNFGDNVNSDQLIKLEDPFEI